MDRRPASRFLIGFLPLILMLVTVPAASALADAKVRVLNAGGGAKAVQLTVEVGGKKVSAGGAAAFGQVGEWATVPAGQARLTAAGRGSATATKALTDGDSYTAVVLPKGSKGIQLEVLRDGSAAPRDARLRIVHAAPELGTPDIRLGDRTIAQGVKFRSASRYLTVSPGSYELAVTKPGGGGAVFKRQISLAAGTADTVVVAGSGGAPERLIMATDDTVTPAGAPHTGLGGLADGGGRPWGLALLAALLAGALGGATQLARRRARP